MRRLIFAAALSAIEAPALSADGEDLARQVIARFTTCQEQQALRSLSENDSKFKFLYDANSVCNGEELAMRGTLIAIKSRDKRLYMEDIKESVDSMIADIKRSAASTYKRKLDEKVKR